MHVLGLFPFEHKTLQFKDKKSGKGKCCTPRSFGISISLGWLPLSPSQAMGTGSRVAPCPGTPLPSDTLLAKSSQGVGKSL